MVENLYNNNCFSLTRGFQHTRAASNAEDKIDTTNNGGSRETTIRAQHKDVLVHGDAVDLLVNVLDTLQQVVEHLVRLPLRLAQSLGGRSFVRPFVRQSVSPFSCAFHDLESNFSEQPWFCHVRLPD